MVRCCELLSRQSRAEQTVQRALHVSSASQPAWPTTAGSGRRYSDGGVRAPSPHNKRCWVATDTRKAGERSWRGGGNERTWAAADFATDAH